MSVRRSVLVVRASVPAAMLLASLFVLAAIATTTAAERQVLDAVKSGNLAGVRAVVKSRADANAAEADGTTALHWAARGNDLRIAEALIAAGANVNAANRYGVTALGIAATQGSVPIVRALLKAGARIDATNGDGEPVLLTAARSGALDVVNLLLDAGADVNASEAFQGETALMWAAGENHAEVVAALAKRGAALDARSKRLEYPNVKVDFATMVFIAMPKSGFTALAFAARQGAMRAAKALLDAGANPDVADPDGTTPLTLAVINAHYELAALLIARGADVNLADTVGMTPLYAAVDMQHQEPLVNRPLPKPSGRLRAADVVATLLEYGADPDGALTAPLLMRQHNNGDPMFGSGATPMMRAAKVSDVALMRVLLDAGADAGRAMKNGNTAAMVAASRAARPPVPAGQTIAALALLREYGADLNAANQNQETALHLAVGRSDEVVSWLVEHGARLDAKDAFGRTPLDVALGVPGGGRGRGAAPEKPPVFEKTADLLRRLQQQGGASR